MQGKKFCYKPAVHTVRCTSRLASLKITGLSSSEQTYKASCQSRFKFSSKNTLNVSCRNNLAMKECIKKRGNKTETKNNRKIQDLGKLVCCPFSLVSDQSSDTSFKMETDIFTILFRSQVLATILTPDSITGGS